MDRITPAEEPIGRDGASPDAAPSPAYASAASGLSTRTKIVLFLTVLVFCSWFFQVGHVNQISRYDAVSAFFENTGDDAHTFRIDRYLYSEGRQMNTSDWSEYGGHYYSNKSPGTTLFGVALLAPVYPLERRLCPDGDGISPRAEIFNAWYLNFVMGVLPTAFSVLALAGILFRLGAGGPRSVLGSLLIVLGTAVYPFSTTLMAHATVAACLVFSLGAYLRGGKAWLAASGAWFGAAVLFDYSAGLLLPLALVAVAMREKDRCWAFLAGGIPFAVLYCAYNAMCFGGPFSFAAQYINPVYKTEGDAAGGLLALPNLWLVLELLFGARRGVFMASPFLLFAVPGFLVFWRQKGLHRGLAVLIAASFAVLLLMNASFNGWHSGASFTARYLVPVFPLVGILAVTAPLKSPRARGFFALLAAVSLLNMFAAAAYSVTPPEHDPSPVYGTCWRHLFDREQPPVLMAQLGLQALRPDAAALRDAARFSVGSLLGLSYRASRLACFLLALTAWGWFLARYGLPGYGESPLRARLSAWFAGVRSVLLARQAGAWTVLACCAAAAVLLLPGDVPFTAVSEYPVQKLALDAADARTFVNPLVTRGFSGLCFQLLYLFTKDVLTLAFLKTALSLALCWWFLSAAAERLRVSAPLLMLFATLTPYLMLAHKSLRGDSLLLPAGAAILYAFAAMYDRAETLLRRASRLAAALAVWSLLTFRMPAGYIGFRGPFAVLQMTFAGFAEVFHPALGEVDREASVCLMLMAGVSVLLMTVLIVTGAVLAIRRRNPSGILSILILLPASLAFLVIRTPYHPFFVLGAAPFAALLATFGAEWYLARRSARAAKIALCVYFALCLCGWLVFLGVIHRDAGNRAESFGVTLSEQQEGAKRINSELRRYAPGPIAVTAKDDAERRMFFPVGWLAALDRIGDPYVQNPNAAPAPGFFITYRDGAKAPTGYLRILSRFRDDSELLRRLPKLPSGTAPAD